MNKETLQAITTAVENAVDTKINGKLLGISNTLKAQDVVLVEVKDLLQERKFLIQLWSFIKFIGGVLVAIGSGILLWKKLS